ncbi:hypothetical protein DDZ16_06895 [Marinilabilia rubra]|uniref:Chromosome partition protein Smc n=2 Tax=Marinilabilia rubra TaxID=2162893 RepID=A0A2U2BAI5_9BACT|nr:hypothetical protein DDZ16_06895 [Marinilabilia rubra]
MFILSGCVVSKKKYEAMVSERNILQNSLNDARNENKALLSDLDQAMADFESMKYKLHKSNALKSDKVSDLFSQSEALKDETSKLKDELAHIKSRYKSQQNTSIERANELQTLRKKVTELTNDTVSLHYSLEMNKERQAKLKTQIKDVKERYNELAASYSGMKNELDQTSRKIEMLEGQLVEKSQSLRSVSEAFIELRKQLLSAKSKGTPIDPNKNKLIDKIARLLGHY